jgi:sporulation protein YlmC with PRC-barrel domain
MKAFTIVSAMAAAWALLVSGVAAQQATTQQERELRQNRGVQRPAAQRQLDRSPHASPMIRASELIGIEVKNNNDEDLGTIDDLAIDPNSGKISYAAVSMGGFLGLGDELFAVPWDAIRLRAEESAVTGEEGATHVALLNVSKEQMEDAEGFDQDNWPDMSNQQWRQQNDQRYQSLRTGANPNRLDNPQ